MTQPPYEPDPNRPQDTPRSFPTYGRPDEPHAQPTDGAGTPVEPEATQPSAAQAGTQWAAPGQPQPETQSFGPSPYAQSPYGQAPYGPSAQPSYGQGAPGQSPYGQVGAGQTPYGQSPHGQAPYGQGYGPGQYPAAYGQAPYSYGYGYAGTTGTNGLATAALATGIGGVLFPLAAPVAIGLGIASLVQIKKRHQAGKGMAIAGLVIGSLVTIGWAVLFGFLNALGATSSDDYGSPQPVSSDSGPTVYVDELAIGDCFDDDGTEEDQVIRQSCLDAHDGEIVGILSLPEGPYPGDNNIEKAADRACTPEFGTYVGKSRDQSELYLSWWTPSKDAWNHDDRRVFCAAYGPSDEKLTGSVKGSKR